VARDWLLLLNDDWLLGSSEPCEENSFILHVVLPDSSQCVLSVCGTVYTDHSFTSRVGLALC